MNNMVQAPGYKSLGLIFADNPPSGFAVAMPSPYLAGMRIVIDSNSLNSEQLRDVLGASSDHCAVISDYAWMEAYKGNPLGIQKSLAVLEQFPDQVLLLKGMRAVGALDARAP